MVYNQVLDRKVPLVRSLNDFFLAPTQIYGGAKEDLKASRLAMLARRVPGETEDKCCQTIQQK